MGKITDGLREAIAVANGEAEPARSTTYVEGPPPATNYMTWEDDDGRLHWEAITPMALAEGQRIRRLTEAEMVDLIAASPIPPSVQRRIASMRRSRSLFQRLRDLPWLGRWLRG